MEKYECLLCGFFTVDFQRFKCHQVTTHECQDESGNDVMKYTRVHRQLTGNKRGIYFNCEFCSCCYDSIVALKRHAASHEERKETSSATESPKKWARKTTNLSVVIKENGEPSWKRDNEDIDVADLPRVELQEGQDVSQSDKAGNAAAKTGKDNGSNSFNELDDFNKKTIDPEFITAAKLDEEELTRLKRSIPKVDHLYRIRSTYKLIDKSKRGTNPLVHFLRYSSNHPPQLTPSRRVQEIIERNLKATAPIYVPISAPISAPKPRKKTKTRNVGTQSFEIPLKRPPTSASLLTLKEQRPREVASDGLGLFHEPVNDHSQSESFRIKTEPSEIDEKRTIEPEVATKMDYSKVFIPSRVIKSESIEHREELKEIDVSSIKKEPIESQDEMDNAPIERFVVKQEPVELNSSYHDQTDFFAT